MQSFGRFKKGLSGEYLSEHYLYIPLENESINTQDLETMLKNRRKSIEGTIFFYNPTLAPLGLNTKTSLEKQGYTFDEKLTPLEIDPVSTLMFSALKNLYKGKLLEIKYFFNINKDISLNPQTMEHLEIDLDRYYSNQLCIFDKELNYHDYQNIRLNGKFVFFASGNKLQDKAFKNVVNYIKNIATQASKLGKSLSFIYDNNFSEEEALDFGYFLYPLIQNTKVKEIRVDALKRAFSTNPPQKIRIK